MALTTEERLRRLERAVADLAQRHGGVQAGSELAEIVNEYRADPPESKEGDRR